MSTPSPVAPPALESNNTTINKLLLTNEFIKERIVACFLALAIGDAKGIAYELKTREQIQDFIAQQNPDKKPESGHKFFTSDFKLYEKVPATHPFMPRDFPIGKWTDDTQLSVAMAIALMDSAKDAASSSSAAASPAAAAVVPVDMNHIVAQH